MSDFDELIYAEKAAADQREQEEAAKATSPKRRVMRRFRLTEISAVDNPAQKGARATIMKRDEGNDERSSAMEHEHDDDISEYRGPEGFLKLAKDCEEAYGLDRTGALRKARKLDPIGFEEFQGLEQPQPFATREAAMRKLHALEFEDVVLEIMKRDDVGRCDAMTKARIEQPEAWAAFAGVELPVAKAHPKDKRDYETMVAGEMERTGCSRLEAQRRVASKRPDLNARKVTEPAERFDGEMAKTKWFRACEETLKANPSLSPTGVLQATRKSNPDLFAAFQDVGGDIDHRGEDVGWQ